MNKSVNYELAKLLKEKGFNEQSSCFYTKPNSKMFGLDEHGRCYPIKNNPKTLWVIGNAVTLNEKNVYLAPTIAEVVMWIYEKYDIWISVDMVFEEHQTGFWYCIRESKDTDHAITSDEYNTSTEAYEAAIQYCLNHLINRMYERNTIPKG